ncbi:hypothetical protein [Frigoribacterium sp. MCBA15_019]|nr:hypothetical protein [Frigoribacterium sp. MCBA15_019]
MPEHFLVAERESARLADEVFIDRFIDSSVTLDCSGEGPAY